MAKIKITIPQMVLQWANASHNFSLNLWNFEVMAGQAARDVFKESFDKGRMNTAHSARWAKRKRQGDGHPILRETSTLRDSIMYRQKKGKRKRGVMIYTDIKTFMNSKRHKGFCFAAVHNAPDNAGFRTKHMANMPQRQFIGDSSVLDRQLNKLNDEIFKGFPK